MDLVDGDQPCAGRDGFDGEAAILGDGGGVIRRAEADIQAGAHALRESAAAAEEAVGEALEGAGAVGFDHHQLLRPSS